MQVTNCKFLKILKINAIVLYPFVFYCDSHPDTGIVLHEQVHLNQIKRDGVLWFYAKYLFEYFKGRKGGLTHYQAYRNISYEKEAYDSARAT